MADWLYGALLTAVGCGVVYATVPKLLLLLAVIPLGLRLGVVLWQAAEGEPHRVRKLCRELAASVWFMASMVPFVGRTALYYHGRISPDLAKDIDFGSPHNGRRNRLDVHSPGGGRSGDSCPVVLFVYGGAWCSGDKATYALVGAALKQHGFVVVIPNYSIYPTGSMAEMVDDVSFALGWTVRHIAEYGGDPRRIYLLGHSAGGHLAISTMLRRWCTDHGLSLDAALPPTSFGAPPSPPLSLLPRLPGSPTSPQQPQRRPLLGTDHWQLSHIRAVISVGAPLDIVDHYEFEQRRSVHLLSGMLPASDGDPEAHSCLRLVEYIGSLPKEKFDVNSIPEVHIVHSTEDAVVPVSQATRFWDALEAAHIPLGPRARLCTGTHSQGIVDVMAATPDTVVLQCLLGIAESAGLNNGRAS